MKAWIQVVLFAIQTLSLFAQSPDRLNYQAVLRNASGSPLSGQSVGSRISILKGSATGSAVYVETQQATTSASGVMNLEIGAGKVESGSLSAIEWSQGPYFIRTETDPSGGTNFQLVGSTQLLSVPYALYAKSASLRYSNTGDTLYSGSHFVIVPGISGANTNASGSGSPTVTTGVVNSVTTASAVLSGNVTNGGSSSVTARGICYATTVSPTVANSTAASGSGTGIFNATLNGLNAGTTYYARAYAVNSSGTSYGNQVSFRTEGTIGQACAQGATMTVTHNAGVVAPVTKIVTYKLVQTDLSRESKCWITQNLGADRQAVTEDDFSEASAGWYWQFNRKQGYRHDGILRTPNSSWITTIPPDSGYWHRLNDPCHLLLGQGWRIPTSTEWSLVSSKWNATYHPFTSELRLHRGGHFLWTTGSIQERGLFGRFATMNANGPDEFMIYDVYHPAYGSRTWGENKNGGVSVRCLMD